MRLFTPTGRLLLPGIEQAQLTSGIISQSMSTVEYRAGTVVYGDGTLATATVAVASVTSAARPGLAPGPTRPS